MTLPALRKLSSVAVYVHVPFCRSRCSYCNFYFETTRSRQLISRTLEAIVTEAEAYAARLGNPRAATIYLGGGTPSVVPPELLTAFLSRLRAAFAFPPLDAAGAAVGEPPEITVEANPESIDERYLAALAEAGVNRLSVGIQSLKDTLLATLGRRTSTEQNRKALAAVRRRWPGKASADLIAAIPGQKHEELEDDIAELIDYGIGHVSLYALSVEPGTPLAQAVDAGTRLMPEADEQDELWLNGARLLEEAGYDWYEISNFAFGDQRSAHNGAYWRYEPYLGLGPGAVGTLPAAAGGRVRISNPDLFRYLSSNGAEQEAAFERLTEESSLFELFLCGLRTAEGISLSRLPTEFAVDQEAFLSRAMQSWNGAAYLQREALADGRFALNRQGRLILNRLLPSLPDVLTG